MILIYGLIPPSAGRNRVKVMSKDVHIFVPFAYLLSLYSKFELKLLRAENAAVQAR